MESIPINWILVEEWDNNYIFENSNRSFAVNVTFTQQFALPYEISFSQLKGEFNLIGYEDGAYSTNAVTKAKALQKSFKMMLFIDSK
ncbi:MAG TPA: hypothetical protein VGK10_16160 [Prolixibacteraceae bacterium]|jgi:hypothetical protein